jgi:hypothetical protein
VASDQSYLYDNVIDVFVSNVELSVPQWAAGDLLLLQAVHLAGRGVVRTAVAPVSIVAYFNNSCTQAGKK